MRRKLSVLVATMVAAMIMVATATALSTVTGVMGDNGSHDRVARSGIELGLAEPNKPYAELGLADPNASYINA